MKKIIYHYCNVEAFKAIIQNRVLWLSSIYNLNDYKEIHWIKDKVKSYIEELKEDNFLKYKTFEDIYLKKSPMVYIASFSQGNDLLSQWRAYANDGYGVAIGFNTEYFKINKLVNISEVLYDEKKQEEKIKDILKPLIKLPSKTNINSLEFEKISLEIIRKLNYLSAKSKNELFQEEQEVRLIHNPIIKDDKKNNRFILKNNISNIFF